MKYTSEQDIIALAFRFSNDFSSKSRRLLLEKTIKRNLIKRKRGVKMTSVDSDFFDDNDMHTQRVMVHEMMKMKRLFVRIMNQT